MKFNKGFSLIELLVVISIIGILSIIVIGSLSGAKERAKDAKIKSLVSQMRTVAEMFALDNGSYYGTDIDGFHDDDIGNCLTSTQAVGSVFDANLEHSLHDLIEEAYYIGKKGWSRVFCATGNSSHDSWAVALMLRNPPTGTTGVCVDSSGTIQSTNINFYGSSNPTQLGGVNSIAKCP